MADIKYAKGVVDEKTRLIENKIENLLAKKAEEYDRMITAFSLSDCEQATAVRAELNTEKEILNTMAEFYTKLITMIHNASKDVAQAEDEYGKNHVAE